MVAAATIAAPLSLLATAAAADEGGSSFWTPGAFASLAATPMEPGFSLTSIYYHTSTLAGSEVARAHRIRIGRRTEPGVFEKFTSSETAKDLAMVSPAYTVATPVLGGQASVNLTATYGRNNTTLNELLSGSVLVGPFPHTRFGFESTESTVTAFGDLTPQASLRWNAGVHNVMVYATGDIPVGQYNPSSIANIGIGHAAVDGGVGYTYLDKADREFSAVGGLTYNFLNPYTQYQNGIDFHLDWAASQFFYSKRLQVGLVGYVYNQLTCDGGSGNHVGCFASRVASVGGQLGYTIPMGPVETNVNLRGYREFDAAYRGEGWNVWLTLSISPAGTDATAATSKRTRQAKE